MKRFFTFMIMSCMTLCAFSQFDLNPVTWNCKVNGNTVDISAGIEKGWHLYDLGPYNDDGPNPTVISFQFSDDKVSKIGEVEQLSEPTRYFDEFFKTEIGYFENSAVFRQKFSNTSSEKQLVKVHIVYQACNDDSCLPPKEVNMQFYVQPSQLAGPNTGKPLWSVILEAILWGFAALLTPCVFPMVPMTVSFFIRNAEKGRFYASIYGISIVATYTIPIALIIAVTYFIGGDAVTADIFNWFATHWIPNLLFFIIFMIFAASFFGAFEIVLPSKLINGSDRNADRGGLVGVFFMALTLVLVSFSCTGPIVGTILVKSTQGEIWEPVITMLAFSTAFALPFTLLAFFPSVLKKMPKSGGWLNTVKVTLGFIELALGLKFLSVADQTYHWGILDREVYLALWIVIFSMLGFYFLGKLRFAYDEKIEKITIKRLVLSIITFAFVIYMIPGMWGAPLRALSGYLPPISSQDFVLGGTSSAAESTKGKYSDFLHLPYGLQGFFDYEEALDYAKKVNKPLFVDFTGHGCVNCREMEANVWSDTGVQKLLTEDYVIVALYVDDKKTIPETGETIGKINAQRQIRMFGTNAQPYYCLLDPFTEKLLVEPRSYDLDVEGFANFLKSGMVAWTKNHESN